MFSFGLLCMQTFGICFLSKIDEFAFICNLKEQSANLYRA